MTIIINSTTSDNIINELSLLDADIVSNSSIEITGNFTETDVDYVYAVVEKYNGEIVGIN